jgi:hypothetical protein
MGCQTDGTSVGEELIAKNTTFRARALKDHRSSIVLQIPTHSPSIFFEKH